jgi:hypothetical protein
LIDVLKSSIFELSSPIIKIHHKLSILSGIFVTKS